MATDIVMPQLGESIAEGTVVKWLIKPGGAVERDQPLLEVETEKVALDVPSPAGGVLSEVMVQEGATVPVGTVLARLETQPAAEGVVNRVGGVGVRARQGQPQGDQHYSPAVRQLAREHGVDLALLTGTGEGGNAFGDRIFIRGFEARNDVYIDGLRDPGVTSPSEACVWRCS